MRSVLTALCLFASTAHAVPSQFTHQGRLLDADDLPLEEDASITFRVLNAESGGTILWEESITVLLTNGFYSAVLGTDEEDNPLDTEILSQAPVWLELQIEGEDPMSPRSAIHTVPYASMATVAEELSGGPVNASQIAVGDTPVVNESGEWVGPTPTVTWEDIEGIPADFADGVDDDTLPESDSFSDLGTSCLDGDIPVWDSTTEEWSCTFDQDTLADMACTEGQLIRWSESSFGWMCTDNSDRVLTEEEVDAMVSNNGYALTEEVFSGLFSELTGVPSDLADGDQDSLQDLACEVGEIAVQTATGWACSTISEQLDADGDGFPVWSDCDDTDAASGSSTSDADCDGISTADDCDDTDALSTTTATDADCDGVPTSEDCNDEDPFSTILAEDADCDGIVAGEDCDDTDASSSDTDEDEDCDGIPSEYDCRPIDPDSSISEAAMMGAASSCPVSSCTEVKTNYNELFSPDSTWSGGTYHIGEIGASMELYCEPADDSGGPWTYVVRFNADTDPCPSSWTTETLGAHTICSRNTSGLRSHTFSVPSMDFTELHGNINGAIEASLDGFQIDPPGDIMSVYADGIGVRMGSTHLHTYAMGHASHHCSVSPPSFVGGDHSCTVVTHDSAFAGPYGTGWWEASIGPGTAQPVTVQLMADQGTHDEDIALHSLDIKIR